MRAHVSLLFASIWCSLLSLAQGPYAPAAGQTGSNAIHRDSSIIQAWASQCTVERGYLDISDPSQGTVSFGNELDGVGYADGAVVSLGDSGTAVLQFSVPIYDGPGPDFAVFENSFSDTFLELAKVFVSSNGVDFVEFPSHSLTPDTSDIGGFGNTDPTNLKNLAGKYRGQYGVPFDLSELSDSSNVSINAITHIMLVDAVGTVNSLHATQDAAGNRIVDPYPTPFASGGFDLDGVAFLQEPITSIKEHGTYHVRAYPNPVQDMLFVQSDHLPDVESAQIFDANGKIVRKISPSEISYGVNLSDLQVGFYVLTLVIDGHTVHKRFIKK